MAHASTRLTRKKIRQPDQFLTLTGQALDYVEKNKKACLIGVGVVLLLAIAFTGWSLYRDRQYQLAATEFDDGLRFFHFGNFRGALTAFEKVQNYSSYPYTTYALLYQADSHLALNESDKAIKALQTLLSHQEKSPVIRQIALMTLGYAHETRGEWQQAAQSYGDAEKADDTYKEEALLSKARCEMQAKDYKTALGSYKSYLTDYPNGRRTLEASLNAQELEAKLKEKAG